MTKKQYIKSYKEAVVNATPFWISCMYNEESKEDTINIFRNML